MMMGRSMNVSDMKDIHINNIKLNNKGIISLTLGETALLGRMASCD